MTDQLDHTPSAPTADTDAELAAAFMSIWGDPEMSSCPQRVHRRLREQGDAVQIRSVLAEWHARVPAYRIPGGVELAYRPGLRSIDHLPLEIFLD